MPQWRTSHRAEVERASCGGCSNSRKLRRFPYDQWLSWRLFAPWLPGLFYFRETQSIHFLPILFSPKELREQLELRVGALEVPNDDTEDNTSNSEQ